jgi:hypothetical protein
LLIIAIHTTLHGKVKRMLGSTITPLDWATIVLLEGGSQPKVTAEHGVEFITKLL